MKTPSASYSVTLRIEYPNRTGIVGEILMTIGEAGAIAGRWTSCGRGSGASGTSP